MAILQAETESGAVRGTYAGNDSVSVFKGIPYAAPPVGELRWRAPQPAAAWTGVRPALEFSPVCWQEQMKPGTFYYKEFYGVEHPMSEDCLTLNIWTPACSASEKLPVAFFIHGGGFTAGMGCNKSYDGEAFARNGVITVTFNYRVGAFGFLASRELTAEDPHHTSGNYGILDQIAALKWVRRNIAVFGGDPERITIFGQSAGGGSVQMLISSPLAQQEISGAIIQSSILLVPVRQPLNQTLEQAEAFGESFLAGIGVSSAAAGRALCAEELMRRYLAFRGRRFALPFKVNVDQYVLQEDMLNGVLSGRHARIPYMIGCTADELDNGPLPEPEPLPAGASLREQIAQKIGPCCEEYVEILDRDKKDLAAMPPRWVSGCCAWSELQLAQGRAPVYQYLFTHQAPGGDQAGAFHSVEHPYVFGTLNRIWRPYTGEDWELSRILTGYWCNFIKNGDPNGAGLPAWHPYTKAQPEVMELKPGPAMRRLMASPYIRFRRKDQ